MNIKKIYSKPEIEEHILDQEICLAAPSDPGPPWSEAAPEQTNRSKGPDFQSPPANEYPFGGKGPDYTNM